MMAGQSTCGRLAGKAAIITGGASGIGLASAEVLAREGASVLVVDQKLEAGEEALARVAAVGGEAEFLGMDVSAEDAPAEMVERCIERFGRLDVLLSNAGVHGSGDTPAQRWDHALDVNLRAGYLSALAAMPQMRDAGGGSIIFTASVAGAVFGFASPHYDASKAGLVGLTRHLASAWGEHNIRVNAVCPGFIETPFIGGGWTERRLAKLLRRIALGRLGGPEEIAGVALFLACDESSYVTGAALVADGGWSIHYTPD